MSILLIPKFKNTPSAEPSDWWDESEVNLWEDWDQILERQALSWQNCINKRFSNEDHTSSVWLVVFLVNSSSPELKKKIEKKSPEKPKKAKPKKPKRKKKEKSERKKKMPWDYARERAASQATSTSKSTTATSKTTTTTSKTTTTTSKASCARNSAETRTERCSP